MFDSLITFVSVQQTLTHYHHINVSFAVLHRSRQREISDRVSILLYPGLSNTFSIFFFKSIRSSAKKGKEKQKAKTTHFFQQSLSVKSDFSNTVASPGCNISNTDNINQLTLTYKLRDTVHPPTTYTYATYLDFPTQPSSSPGKH